MWDWVVEVGTGIHLLTASLSLTYSHQTWVDRRNIVNFKLTLHLTAI